MFLTDHYYLWRGAWGQGDREAAQVSAEMVVAGTRVVVGVRVGTERKQWRQERFGRESRQDRWGDCLMLRVWEEEDQRG